MSSAPKRDQPTRTPPDGDSRAEMLREIGYQETWVFSVQLLVYLALLASMIPPQVVCGVKQTPGL